MQTVITWTRYDGTPETLPGQRDSVMVVEFGSSWVEPWSAHCRFYGADTWTWDYDHHEERIKIGDLWAPWPAAPQGVE